VLRSGWVSSPPVFWIFMEQGMIMEAEAPTVRVGATPTGLTAPHPHNTPRFFTGRMTFLPPNQQRQSTDGITESLLYYCSLFLENSKHESKLKEWLDFGI